MIEWLTDTLVTTGALMALILLVRRPVARWFGTGAAYALWALPMIRLVLPPLALPRGLVPHFEFDVEPVTASATGLQTAPVEIAQTVTALPVTHAALALPASGGVGNGAVIEPSLLAQVPWLSVALFVWLAGAVLFLAWRTVTYRWMRRDLLDGARLVARSGEVRIVETRAISAPLAFGVFDKVVALPWGFLAEAESETSDFAIAHEMEHHAGNDLLALIALQPLFALHWFNPIGWMGWRAVRADQEAFCDARVMDGRSRAERARYGRLIASMAGGARLGLAAPMAGPLSGEKPIIQRLKALAAQDVSPLRRVLARSLFALAVAAVPATATVSYAAMDEAEVPEPPTPPAAPEQPAAPASPVMTDDVADADASDVPEPPVPPAAPRMHGSSMAVLSPPEPPAPPMPPRASAIPVPPVPPVPPAPPAPSVSSRVMSDARRADAQARDAERHAADAERMAAYAAARAPRVEETVSRDGKRHTIRIVSRDGARVSERTMVLDEGCPADSRASNGGSATRVICTGEPRAAKQAAITALRNARSSMAMNTSIDTGTRTEILADLDREIADAFREGQDR